MDLTDCVIALADGMGVNLIDGGHMKQTADMFRCLESLNKGTERSSTLKTFRRTP